MITILDYAIWANPELGTKSSISAQDLYDLNLPFFGGCCDCEASIAAFNAYPCTNGYLRCKECTISSGEGYSSAKDFHEDSEDCSDLDNGDDNGISSSQNTLHICNEIKFREFDFIREKSTNEIYLVLGSIRVPHLDGEASCDYSTHILDLKNLKNDSDIEHVLCYITWNVFKHIYGIVFEHDHRFEKIGDVENMDYASAVYDHVSSRITPFLSMIALCNANDTDKIFSDDIIEKINKIRNKRIQ